MKSFIFFGVLWLALGYIRPSSQTMTDYLTYNTELSAESYCDQNSTYGATCLQLYSKIIYQCPYGFYYKSTCRLGKVFPGEMILRIPYNESIENTRSESYEILYDNLTTFFQQTFKVESRNISVSIRIVKLSPETSKSVNKVENKNGTTVTNQTKVTLITTFDEKANMTVMEWQKAVNSSTFLDEFNIISFKGISGCDIQFFNCDKNTTNCTDVDGGIPKCECINGLDKVNSEDKACRVCNQSCSAENNRFCLIKANLIPGCQCLPNFKEKDGECKACGIGFSGEDCQDSYMAIIIGISTFCGVLLVALIGVTTYVLVRKQDPKHRELISNEYSTLDNPFGDPPATNLAESGIIFPRIRATNGEQWSRATAENPTNFYEGGAANRGYFPEQEHSNDNWLEMPSKY